MGEFKISYAVATKEETIRYANEQEMMAAKANFPLLQRLEELEDRMKAAAAKQWLLQKVGKEQVENWQVIVHHSIFE